MSQKTLRKTTKTYRFEKNLLVFFDLMASPKFSRINKTLNDLHQALELGTNLLNISLSAFAGKNLTF